METKIMLEVIFGIIMFGVIAGFVFLAISDRKKTSTLRKEAEKSLKEDIEKEKFHREQDLKEVDKKTDKDREKSVERYGIYGIIPNPVFREGSEAEKSSKFPDKKINYTLDSDKLVEYPDSNSE